MTDTLLTIVGCPVDDALLYFRPRKGLDRLKVFV